MENTENVKLVGHTVSGISDLHVQSLFKMHVCFDFIDVAAGRSGGPMHCINR